MRISQPIVKSNTCQNRYRRSIFIFLITMFFLANDVMAVDCTGTSIFLENQAEVDSFQTNHGGGGTCDTVPGFLNISGEDITNLDGLAALEHIGTNLWIYNVPVLANINGLWPWQM